MDTRDALAVATGVGTPLWLAVEHYVERAQQRVLANLTSVVSTPMLDDVRFNQGVYDVLDGLLESIREEAIQVMREVEAENAEPNNTKF